MTLQFNCECGQTLRAQEEHAGRRTKCPACGREFPIPQPKEAVQPPPAAPPSSPVQERKPDPVSASERRREEDPPRPKERSPATSGKAIAALVLGLGSCPLWCLCSVPAIILAILSLRDISKSQGQLKGTGLAITSLVVAGLLTVICWPVFAIFVLPALVVPAVQNVREAAARNATSNNLRAINMALFNYHTQHDTFPPPVIQRPGEPPHSWRVALLPYLPVDEGALYKQYNTKEPWNSPNNSRLLSKMPKVYSHPMADPAKTAGGNTYYRVFMGPNTGLGVAGPSGLSMIDIKDGTSNTILVVEAKDPVPWMEPEGLPFNPSAPPPVGGLFSKGFFVGMADGSVLYIRKDFNRSTFNAAVTRNGGEVIDFSSLQVK